MSSTSRLIWRGSLLALLAFLAVSLFASSAHAGPDCDKVPLPPVCGGDPPPKPPPAPPAPPVPKYEIWTHDGPTSYHLFVSKIEDFYNEDEAYLKINGTKVWGPKSVIAGGWYKVPIRVPFSGSGFDIAMYDEDWPDPDDNLGSFRVNTPALSVGHSVPRTLKFDADSADYRLHINIKRVS